MAKKKSRIKGIPGDAIKYTGGMPHTMDEIMSLTAPTIKETFQNIDKFALSKLEALEIYQVILNTLEAASEWHEEEKAKKATPAIQLTPEEIQKIVAARDQHSTQWDGKAHALAIKQAKTPKLKRHLRKIRDDAFNIWATEHDAMTEKLQAAGYFKRLAEKA